MPIPWESLEEDSRQDIWDSWPGAVLLDDEIEYYAKHPRYPLISPFYQENLKPARYQLTLGPEARVGGRTVKIDADNPLVLQPHQVAIVRTSETLNIPRFLIGRWNLTVGAVYRGLLWVGALQVDPGWVGYLPCPLYNLSNSPVEIKLGERLFTIDFVRTTRFSNGSNRKYPHPIPEPPQTLPQQNPPIHFYDENNLRSGPYEIIEQVEGLRKDATDASDAVAKLKSQMSAFAGIMFAVLAVMVAALAVVAVGPTVKPDGPLLNFWPMTALVGSAVAFVLSVFSIRLHLSSKRRRRP